MSRDAMRMGVWAAAGSILLYAAFSVGIGFSATWIWDRPEYSHGLVIPFVAAFLIWQRRDSISEITRRGSWWGPLIVLFAVCVNLMGQLSSLFIVQQYAALFGLYGLVLAFLGVAAFRKIWVALLLLLFMIPLPEFLYQGLSAELQLISSRLGVWVIRHAGIPVYLEGNVIDLGSYKLQVAEACSGLRYLFPLMTLGFIMAYFFHASFWKRLALFLSTIPITILMNSFRIGVIGVLVDRYGIGQAEGFLHSFEGWVIFMGCFAVLVLEIVAFSWLSRDARPWREVFGIDIPPPRPRDARPLTRPIPASFLASLGLLALAAVVGWFLPQRAEAIPTRKAFLDFPVTFGSWTGRRDALDSVYTEDLKLDDYLLADFRSSDSGAPINVYVAWYDTQRAGRSTHSPRSCLPSGGWDVERLEPVQLPGMGPRGQALSANRAVIAKEGNRLLVYYLFKQRQRWLTNEYVVKWYLFWDSLTQNRSDGALVRFSVPVPESQSVEAADARLRGFMAEVIPRLPAFVPD